MTQGTERHEHPHPIDDHTDDHTGDGQHPATFWDRRYGEKQQIWSGRVNRTLAEVAAGLTPGRALDLGCGEGADAIWLALQGWTVTGVDISTTAVRRARQAAEAADLDGEQVRFIATDLGDPDSPSPAVGTTDGMPQRYDLVTACFFHSPVALDRTAILRRRAGLIPAGGHLLLVTHAAAPPWADPDEVAGHRFLTPAEDLAELDLDPRSWDVVLAEIRPREAQDPDGAPSILDDGVILVRRR